MRDKRDDPADCCSGMHAYLGSITNGREGLAHMHDDTYSLNGCCGGGCYVMTGMRFCPFCGYPMKRRISACEPAAE